MAPDMVFKVLSEHDRWSEVLAKVAEYLAAGVTAVCVVDPDNARVNVYRDQQACEVFGAEDELRLPEISPEFRVKVARFFE